MIAEEFITITTRQSACDNVKTLRKKTWVCKKRWLTIWDITAIPLSKIETDVANIALSHLAQIASFLKAP